LEGSGYGFMDVLPQYLSELDLGGIRESLVEDDEPDRVATNHRRNKRLTNSSFVASSPN
jgi:hypothetical protein